MKKILSEDNFINFITILFCIIPIGLITGPFLPDLFLTIIIFIFIYLIIKNKEIEYIKNRYFVTFLFFCTTISIISLFSINVLPSIKNSLTYIRFGLFVIATIYILEKRPNIIKYLKIIFIFIFFFTCDRYNFSASIFCKYNWPVI